MAVRRLLGDLRELRAEIKDLLVAEARAEEEARMDLAASTRRFSRRARRVVDDKLTFSATLMRAGEVDAAHRLLEEVEREVRVEEAALIEQVNEVNAARAVRRARLTRLRLARSLAAALIGSLVLSSGALALSVGGFVARLGESASGLDVAAPGRAARAGAAPLAKAAAEAIKENEGIGIKKVKELLSPEEIEALEQLVGAQAPSSVIQQFLLARLPGTVVELRRALQEITAAAAPEPLPPIVVEPEKKKRGAKKAAKAKAPEPEASPEPEPEPEPSPSPSAEPEQDGGKDGDGGGGSGDEEGKDAGGLPPLPSP